jgi:glutamate synthase domain-containing protein 3
MTGGRAVILGETGRNFAPGMSGGIAYVWDATGSFRPKVNKEMVELEPLDHHDLEYVKGRIEKHVEYTDSSRGREILANVGGGAVEVRQGDAGRLQAGDRGTPQDRGTGTIRGTSGGGQCPWVSRADS